MTTRLLEGHEGCPTCGSPGELYDEELDLHYTVYKVECSNGKCTVRHITRWYNTAHAAIAAWDTRHPTAGERRYKAQRDRLAAALREVRDTALAAGLEDVARYSNIVANALEEVGL